FLILVAQALACDFLVHANPGKNHRLKPVPLKRRIGIFYKRKIPVLLNFSLDVIVSESTVLFPLVF
ncbi:MAG: hypothetical protein WAU82_20415, partial [Candidatus Binatus sp.]|uniref:hypothetical protein n=1 Tax=Candidatus Binatus sp. TaxID=2811406 RepID=UPI003BAF3B36